MIGMFSQLTSHPIRDASIIIIEDKQYLCTIFPYFVPLTYGLCHPQHFWPFILGVCFLIDKSFICMSL